MLRRALAVLATCVLGTALAAGAAGAAVPYFVPSGGGGRIWSAASIGAGTTVTLGAQVVSCGANWSIGSGSNGRLGGSTDQDFVPLFGPCTTNIAGVPTRVTIATDANCDWTLTTNSLLQIAYYDAASGFTGDLMAQTCATRYSVVGTTCVVTAPATFIAHGITMQDRRMNDTADANPPTTVATGSRLTFDGAAFPFTSAGCAGVIPASGAGTLSANWQIGPTAAGVANAFWVEA